MSSAKKNFYAVRNGRNPGIYTTWSDCKAQVDGFANAQYKGFVTRREAEDFLAGVAAPARAPAALSGLPEKQETIWPANERAAIVFTDGACSGNPGPGGYGAIIRYHGEEKELAGGFRRTTNNRMEILGCIVALQSLPEPTDVTLYSDSQYVINTMTKDWAVRWRKNGWRRREQSGEWKDAINPDLWAQMLELCDFHTVHFEWVRGHSGHVENERCDELARKAAAFPNLAIDTGYETANR